MKVSKIGLRWFGYCRVYGEVGKGRFFVVLVFFFSFRILFGFGVMMLYDVVDCFVRYMF